jgi:hypothetical protein
VKNFFVLVDELDHEKFRIFRLNKLVFKEPSSKEMQIWGVSKNSEHDTWNKIKMGDGVFFGEKNMQIKCYGIVSKKLISYKLSKSWGSDPRSKTINHFLMFKNLSEPSIEFHTILKWTGLKSMAEVFSGIYEIKDEFAHDISKYNMPKKESISTKSSEKSQEIVIPLDYDGAPDKDVSEVIRFIRDTTKSKLLKKKYDNKCQVCNYKIKVTDNTYYSEVHHILPLKNGGPDNFSNMIVLCPTHHAEFDYRVIGISLDGKSIINKDGENIGKMNIQNDHKINKNNIKFHLSAMMAK